MPTRSVSNSTEDRRPAGIRTAGGVAILLALVLAGALAVDVSGLVPSAEGAGQTPPSAAPPPQAPPPAPPAQPSSPPPPSVAPASWAELGEPVNIRIDLTIRDEAPGAEPETRALVLTVADRQRGSIRTSMPSGFGPPLFLNVDAHPVLLENNRVRVQLTLERGLAERPFTPRVTGEDTPARGRADLRQSFGVILEDGKPLQLSQSADPATGRKVMIEVKSTILR